jgi:membrane-associated phospholipid phosphatase
MEDMHYLREDRKLFYIAGALPVFFFYLDKTIILWIKGFYNELQIRRVFESLDPLINVAGNGATLILGALMICVAGKFLSRKMFIVGKSLLIGLLSSGIVVQVMKHLIGRARPRLTSDSIFIGPSFRSGYDSFPSGHSTLVFCLAYILSRHFPKYRIVFYLFASVVALDRVEDFAHFPSDILAGAMVGLIVAKILSVRVFPSGGMHYAGNTTES